MKKCLLLAVLFFATSVFAAPKCAKGKICLDSVSPGTITFGVPVTLTLTGGGFRSTSRLNILDLSFKMKIVNQYKATVSLTADDTRAIYWHAEGFANQQAKTVQIGK
jgi:hypothetical protein